MSNRNLSIWLPKCHSLTATSSCLRPCISHIVSQNASRLLIIKQSQENYVFSVCFLTKMCCKKLTKSFKTLRLFGIIDMTLNTCCTHILQNIFSISTIAITITINHINHRRILPKTTRPHYDRRGHSALHTNRYNTVELFECGDQILGSLSRSYHKRLQ